MVKEFNVYKISKFEGTLVANRDMIEHGPKTAYAQIINQQEQAQ